MVVVAGVVVVMVCRPDGGEIIGTEGVEVQAAGRGLEWKRDSGEDGGGSRPSS